EEAELAFEIERTQYLATDYARGEAGRVALDRRDHQVGDSVAALVPRLAVRQLRRDVLAEQAGHMRARRRQAVVERGRDQHLDDRLAANAEIARVPIGAVHVAEARRQDDPRGEVISS